MCLSQGSRSTKFRNSWHVTVSVPSFAENQPCLRSLWQRSFWLWTSDYVRCGAACGIGWASPHRPRPGYSLVIPLSPGLSQTAELSWELHLLLLHYPLQTHPVLSCLSSSSSHTQPVGHRHRHPKVGRMSELSWSVPNATVPFTFIFITASDELEECVSFLPSSCGWPSICDTHWGLGLSPHMWLPTLHLLHSEQSVALVIYVSGL